MKQPLGPPKMPRTDGPARKHEARLAWLRDHPDLLTRLPGVHDDVNPAESEALDAAVRGLRLVQLVGGSTPNNNARWGIRLAVSEIRGQHVGT